MNESREASNSQLFQHSIKTFIDEITSMYETLPMQLILLDVKLKDLFEKLENISDEKVEEKDDDGNVNVKFKISPDKTDKLPKIHKSIERTRLAQKIIPRNYVVSLISQYDAFLGNVSRAMFLSNTNLIRSSDKVIEPENIFNSTNIQELKHSIIDKEIDTLLRKDHFGQLKRIETKISQVTKKNFTLTKEFPALSKFIEIAERRNLFVHSNGIVSEQYLEKSRKFDFDLEKKYDLGDEITANPDYCRNAYNIVYEVGVKLGHVLWRKLLPNDRQKADELLNRLIYDLLVDEKYHLAIKIGDFANNTLKSYSSEKVRKYMIVNQAIAYKMIRDDSSCKKIIESEDWSLGKELKLAKEVLLENYESASKTMENIGDEHEVLNKEAYKKWPLFNQFRDTELFRKTYEVIFDEKFMLEEVQPKVDEEKDNEYKSTN